MSQKFQTQENAYIQALKGRAGLYGELLSNDRLGLASSGIISEAGEGEVAVRTERIAAEGSTVKVEAEASSGAVVSITNLS